MKQETQKLVLDFKNKTVVTKMEVKELAAIMIKAKFEIKYATDRMNEPSEILKS